MKKLFCAVLCLGLFFFSLPAQTDPDDQTRRWERMLIQQLEQILCGPKGQLATMFKISSPVCRRTYRFAARQCTAAVRNVSYYSVSDRSTGENWGKIIGTCIGLAFDYKYTYRHEIP
jgi:hypothetical protein